MLAFRKINITIVNIINILNTPNAHIRVIPLAIIRTSCIGNFRINRIIANIVNMINNLFIKHHLTFVFNFYINLVTLNI